MFPQSDSPANDALDDPTIVPRQWPAAFQALMLPAGNSGRRCRSNEVQYCHMRARRSFLTDEDEFPSKRSTLEGRNRVKCLPRVSSPRGRRRQTAYNRLTVHGAVLAFGSVLIVEEGWRPMH
jgi:hypothetical protein